METNGAPAPKKSLGQNFLHSASALDAIVETAHISSQDIVVEVGPGKGALTEGLLSIAREVIAIEKDARMVMYLRLKFKQAIENGKLTLIEKDVLEWDPEADNLRPEGYKLVANIPYYITGQFIRRFLSEVAAPSRMVLMLQKEVAKRIVAKEGKESVLSISVKAFGKPHLIKTVPAGAFYPRPSVDSAILLVERINRDTFKRVNQEQFFAAVKVGFARKRKKLSSNLSLRFTRESVQDAFKTEKLSENTRAEDVPLEVWKRLAEKLEPLSESTAS